MPIRANANLVRSQRPRSRNQAIPANERSIEAFGPHIRRRVIIQKKLARGPCSVPLALVCAAASLFAGCGSTDQDKLVGKDVNLGAVAAVSAAEADTPPSAVPTRTQVTSGRSTDKVDRPMPSHLATEVSTDTVATDDPSEPLDAAADQPPADEATLSNSQ
jgi:hypothetical protein